MRPNKRIAALTLALALTTGLAVPAMAAEDVSITDPNYGTEAYKVLGVEGKEAAVDASTVVSEENSNWVLFSDDFGTMIEPLIVKPGVVADLEGAYSAQLFPLTLKDGKLVNDWTSAVEGTDYTLTLIRSGEDDPEAYLEAGSCISVTREGYYVLNVTLATPGYTVPVNSVIHVTANPQPATGNTAPAETAKPAAETSANAETGSVAGDIYAGLDGNINFSISDVVSKETKTLTIGYNSVEATVYKIPSSGATFTVAYDGTAGDYTTLSVKTEVYLLNEDGSYSSKFSIPQMELNHDNGFRSSAEEKQASGWYGEKNVTPGYLLSLQSITNSVGQELFFYQFTDESAPAPAAPTVAPSPCAVTLDGKAVTLNAYLFTEGNGGTNYVMLRDVAYLLNGTQAQFEVTWDKDKGIILTTGQPYTAVGGEMQGKGDGAKAYTPNASTITIDGKAVELTAYTIEGNNYFKLRDLGSALGFGVDWDSVTGTVTITSGK